MVALCSCSHPAQDRLHGSGKRVHNELKDGRWRCTVCGQVKDRGHR